MIYSTYDTSPSVGSDRTGWSAGKASACSSSAKTQPKPLLYLSRQPDPTLIYHKSARLNKHIITDDNSNVKPARAAAPQATAATANATAAAAGPTTNDQKPTKKPPAETTIKSNERTDTIELGRTTVTSGGPHARPTCRSSSPMDAAKPAACLTATEPSPVTVKMEMGQDRDTSPLKHRSDHRKPPTAPAAPPKPPRPAEASKPDAACRALANVPKPDTTAEAAKTQSAWNSVASLLHMPRKNDPPTATTNAPSDRKRDAIGPRELEDRTPNLDPLSALDTKPSVNADEREHKDPDLIVRLFNQLQPEPMGRTRETAELTLATAPANPPMSMTTIGTAAYEPAAPTTSSPVRATTSDETRLKELDDIELDKALTDVT